MKEKFDKLQSAAVSGFAVVSIISSCIQPAIKLVKSGIHAGYKETGIHQMLFASPAPKQRAKKNK
jgi:hypothetical protein